MTEVLSLLTFSHIGIAVRSVDAFKASWGALLGIAEWSEADVEALPGSVQLLGELQGAMGSRVAFAKCAGTAFELIEPRHGRPHAAHHLETRGEGLHHVAFWVPDLSVELAKLHPDTFDVVYSPSSLRPDLAVQPVAAVLPGPPGGTSDAAPRPPFFAYIERTLGLSMTVELLDSRFASAYRCFYGDQVFYPDELPTSEP